MILTPQETYPMRGRPYDKILTGLMKAQLMNDLSPIANTGGKGYAVIEGEMIPPFTLPIVFKNSRGEDCFAVDLRMKKEDYTFSQDGRRAITPYQYSDTEFLVQLAISQLLWMNAMGAYTGIYNDVAKLYGFWIGKKVSKRLSLQKEDEFKLIALMMYYFFSQSYRQQTVQQAANEYQYNLGKIALALRMNVDEVETLLKGIRDINGNNLYTDFDDFCRLVGTLVDTPKMKHFNRVLLQQIIIGSWTGLNSRELVAVASEYPPYFIFLVYRGLNQRSYKDTDITQIANNQLSAVQQKQFNLYLADILRRFEQG